VNALRDLSQEEMIALIQRLFEEVRRLETEVRALREEVEQYKKPPTTSQNSSQPPSRDWKADHPQRKRRKKVGAKPGHAKAERPLVDNPEKVVEVWVEACAQCGTGLLDQAPERVIRRQVAELPEIKPVVIETRQYEVRCPGCQRLHRGALPEGLEASRRFGPRLEALVTYLHHEHHLGFERLCRVMRDVFGTSLSEGGAVAIVERAGQAAQPEAQAIGERARQSAVMASDETSARVHGRNHWEWVFIGNGGEYHLIRRSRGQDVIDEFMAEYRAEVWLSDCWKPQLNAPADQHQLCLPHQVRALQGLLDKRPQLAWAREMQTLFRTAMHLGKRREILTARGYRRQVAVMERRLDRLLARRVSGVGANLLDRYRTHRAHLLVFLHRPDVPSDNNACERALRPSVIHRKVMGSFRSDWGAQAYAALATVLNTAKRAGENVFQKLIDLMGAPVLHFLQPSIA
jgi:transposase